MADPNAVLKTWLEHHRARLLADGEVGRQQHHLYMVNGHLLIVAHEPNQDGWDIYIPANDRDNKAETALKAAEIACGFQPDDDYNIAFDILTEAVQKMGTHGITRDDVIPSLVDFTATVAVAMGGEDAMRACIIRLGDRIKDLHEGTFPLREET